MKYRGECLLVQTTYAVHAKGHTRGMDNLSFTVNVCSVYDLLGVTSKLKAAGYAKVNTVKCGHRHLHPTTLEVVDV